MKKFDQVPEDPRDEAPEQERAWGHRVAGMRRRRCERGVEVCDETRGQVLSESAVQRVLAKHARAERRAKGGRRR